MAMQYQMQSLQLKGGSVPPPFHANGIKDGGNKDFDINFERDFGQWFNDDNVSLDMMDGTNKDQVRGNKVVKPEDTSRNAGQTSNVGGTARTSRPGPPNSHIAPSPSSVLGTPLKPGPMVNHQLSDSLFLPDFMQYISTLDEYNTSIFPAETDINFEREFGQWFNDEDGIAEDALRNARDGVGQMPNASMFPTETVADIDFERDFGKWFNDDNDPRKMK